MFWRMLLLVVVICGAVGAWVVRDYKQSIDTPLAIPDTMRQFTIEPGWSAKRVAGEFARAGVLDKPRWFELYARLSETGTAIKTGEFQLEESMSIRELMDTFVAGRTVQYSASIIEGQTTAMMLTQLSAVDDLEHTLKDDTPAAVMAALGQPDLHPEGQFFADTYAFPRGTTDLDFLRRAHETLNSVLEQEWAERVDGLPLNSPYEALILASIVEKETAVPAERPLIAGVFHARLNKGMRLQTDPTVIYGIGPSYDGNIRKRDLTTDTPYNTYTRAGLPPTPIALVGREAIHAVLHPESTSALYFVARGDGTHQFSETYEQHEAAVRKYQLKR